MLFSISLLRNLSFCPPARTAVKSTEKISIIEFHFMCINVTYINYYPVQKQTNAFRHFPLCLSVFGVYASFCVCDCVYVYRCVNLLDFTKCRIHLCLYRFVEVSLFRAGNCWCVLWFFFLLASIARWMRYVQKYTQSHFRTDVRQYRTI